MKAPVKSTQMAPNPIALPRRRRAHKPRSTTGCNTCRIRRIKCDEAEPSCGQCVRGRRTCDGYVNKTCLSLRQRKSLPTSPADLSVSILVGTDQERRVFDYFRCRVVPGISSSPGSPFWDRLLLQATHHQPAIWHAVVALGSLHWYFETIQSNKSDHQDGFALQQYVKAIAYVLVPIREKGKQAADVALMSCVLFTCFEILRGHYKAALSHIDGGVNIISELQSGDPNTTLSLSPNPYVSLPVLSQMFSRLDAQASQITNRRPRHLLHRSTPETDTGSDMRIPASFHTFDESHNALDDICTCAMKSIQSLPPPRPITDPASPMIGGIKVSLDLIRNSSAIRLKQWSSAFEKLLQERNADLSAIELRYIQLLKLHRVMAEVNFNVDFARATRDETMWDEYFKEFEAILRHAESLLGSAEAPMRSTFILDTELILPLYFVAAKCRHGKLRRKAISLLRSQQRQEGIWNSILTARVAEYLMQIEEEGLDGAVVTAADVSRRKRVLGVEFTFDLQERRARVSYVKFKESGGVERLNEWVEWDSLERHIH